MISLVRLLIGALALLVALPRAAAGTREAWRQRRLAPRPVPAWRAPVVHEPESTRMRTARVATAVLGVIVVAFGVLVILQTVRWTQYLGIIVWLGAAVVLHDAVLVPAVTGLRAALVRASRPLPAGAVGIIQGGFVVGAVLSLAVLPEVWAQHLGTRNPSVLPVDYLARLLTTWAAIIASVVVAVLALTLLQWHRDLALRPVLPSDAAPPAAAGRTSVMAARGHGRRRRRSR